MDQLPEETHQLAKTARYFPDPQKIKSISPGRHGAADPLDKNAPGREKGVQDQPPLGQWSLAEGKIDEIAAPSQPAMSFLEMEKETLQRGKGRRGEFLQDLPAQEFPSPVEPGNRQAEIDKFQQTQGFCFRRHVIPVEAVRVSLDGIENITNENEAVKGMTDP